MAVITPKTLVLNGVYVVRDVVTVTLGKGFDTVNAQTLAMPFCMRQPSQRYPQAVQEAGQRLNHADQDGADNAADRAGRPGCCPGVLASRSPALGAGRIISTRWSLATGGSRPTAAWRFDRMPVKPARASVGMVLPGRIPPSRDLVLGSGKRFGLPVARWARKHAAANLAWLKPAGGAPSASTRG